MLESLIGIVRAIREAIQGTYVAHLHGVIPRCSSIVQRRQQAGRCTASHSRNPSLPQAPSSRLGRGGVALASKEYSAAYHERLIAAVRTTTALGWDPDHAPPAQGLAHHLPLGTCTPNVKGALRDKEAGSKSKAHRRCFGSTPTAPAPKVAHASNHGSETRQ